MPRRDEPKTAYLRPGEELRTIEAKVAIKPRDPCVRDFALRPRPISRSHARSLLQPRSRASHDSPQSSVLTGGRLVSLCLP